MKKYILPFMSIALLMAMASCSSSDDEVAEIKEESKLVPMTFTATQESNVGTRAALDGNSVIWKDGDKISVFDGEGNGHNQTFTLTGNVAEGKFSGTASSEATKFTAVYPYTEGAQLESEGSVSGITLHAEQTATAGSFDPKAALMMAVSTTENKNQLGFKNAVSLVKIQTGFDCKQIVLSAKEDIAGTGTMNYNGGKPSITFDSNQSKTVTLKPSTEGGVIAAGTYYIAICPHNSTGFSISFINSDDSKAYTRTSTKENTFNRSKIKDLGTFTDGGTWSSIIDKNGNVNASQQVDMGLTIKDGVKQYRVIFAKSNLTKSGLAAKESDFGDYFAFAATEPWLVSYTRVEEADGLKLRDLIWKDNNTYNTYAWSTVPYKNDTNNGCGEYTSNGAVLDMRDDAARQILQGDWKLPTKDIWVNLYNTSKYDWDWTTIDGYNGYQVTSQTDYTKTIFLPAPGHVSGSSFNSVGSHGHYWSGTACSSTVALDLFFNRDEVDGQHSDLRYYGFSVRPVRLVEVPQSPQ